jgi:hypothetical protein
VNISCHHPSTPSLATQGFGARTYHVDVGTYQPLSPNSWRPCDLNGLNRLSGDDRRNLWYPKIPDGCVSSARQVCCGMRVKQSAFGGPGASECSTEPPYVAGVPDEHVLTNSKVQFKKGSQGARGQQVADDGEAGPSVLNRRDSFRTQGTMRRVLRLEHRTRPPLIWGKVRGGFRVRR